MQCSFQSARLSLSPPKHKILEPIALLCWLQLAADEDVAAACTNEYNTHIAAVEQNLDAIIIACFSLLPRLAEAESMVSELTLGLGLWLGKACQRGFWHGCGGMGCVSSRGALGTSVQPQLVTVLAWVSTLHLRHKSGQCRW